jgi:hypothetical protein
VIDEDPVAVLFGQEHGIPPVHRRMANDAEQLRSWLLGKAASKERVEFLLGSITEKQIGYLNGLLSAIFGKDDAGTVARHQFLEYVFGVTSSKKLTKAEASALIDWAKPALPQKGAHPTAVREGWMVLDAWGIQHGQLELWEE